MKKLYFISTWRSVAYMKLLLAAVVLVVSAMCLEGLLGTNLSLNADRRGDTDTFDVSASFTAVDADGNAMAGASVNCAGASGQFSSKGTTNSEGTLSVSESFTLSSSDCPRKEVTKSCYAEKGSTKTETVSDTVELECRSAETSMPTSTTATATPAVTSTSTTTATPSEDRAGIADIQGTTYTMCTKEIRTISVEMKNEGTTTWTSSYALVPTTAYQWGVFHVPSGETTRPGGTKKFTFSIVAPSAPGKYPLQWQMRNAAGNLFPEKGPLSVEEFSPWMITVAACTPTPAPAQGSSCVDSGVAYNLNMKGSCTPAAGKVCIGTGMLACSDLCNPDNKKDWIRKYQCVTSGPDTGACGFSDYQCPAGCQDGTCKSMYPA